MPRRDTLGAELDALAAAVESPTADREHDTTASRPHDDPADHPWAADIEALMRDLQGQLAQTAAEAEDIVLSHPFAAVASALLLGIAIGHMTRRR